MQVSKNGMVNSVFTLYELSNGEDTEKEGITYFMFLLYIALYQQNGNNIYRTITVLCSVHRKEQVSFSPWLQVIQESVSQQWMHCSEWVPSE